MALCLLLLALKKRPRPSCYLPEKNDPDQVVTYLKEMTQAKLPTLNNPGQVVTYLKETTQAKLLPTLKKRPRPSCYLPERNDSGQVVTYPKETT